MSLGTYKKYRDSGIEWLGNIPEHWRIVRIKDFTSTQSGTTPTSGNDLYYQNGIHNWIRTTDLNDYELLEVEFKVTDLAIKKCRLKFLPVNTLLVAMYGGFGTIGKNAILKKESTINQSVCAILPNSTKFNHNYLSYFLKYFRFDWKIFADGTRKDPNINQDAVRNLFLFNPPINEQIQIANYLDRKTQAIDKKVELLKQKTDKYKELRKSLIKQTITKGLNPAVEFKDSGIDWIGKIPKHWEVKRIKDDFKCYTGNSISDKTNFENRTDAKSYISTKDIDFETGAIEYENGIYIPNSDLSFRIAKANSTLICLEGANAGKKIGFTVKDIGFVNKLLTLKSKNKKILDKYFFYSCLSSSFKEQFFSNISGMIGGVSLNLVKNFIWISPSLEEQSEIAFYLDKKTNLIDSIISNIAKQITALVELRKTLINDVVTGKLKVSDN